MSQAGYCTKCNKVVFLTSTGGCENGCPPDAILLPELPGMVRTPSPMTAPTASATPAPTAIPAPTPPSAPAYAPPAAAPPTAPRPQEADDWIVPGRTPNALEKSKPRGIAGAARKVLIIALCILGIASAIILGLILSAAISDMLLL